MEHASQRFAERHCILLNIVCSIYLIVPSENTVFRRYKDLLL